MICFDTKKHRIWVIELTKFDCSHSGSFWDSTNSLEKEEDQLYSKRTPAKSNVTTVKLPSVCLGLSMILYLSMPFCEDTKPKLRVL